MEPETKGIRYQSATYPTVQNLMHNVNEQTLMVEHKKQARKKATSHDSLHQPILIGWNAQRPHFPICFRDVCAPYCLRSILELFHLGYKFPNIFFRISIIGCLVNAVYAGLLNDVYEVRFLDCSYGFRPKRSAHDVVRYINQTIMTKKVNYVLEADIKGFFDNVNHDWLMKFLAHDIQDKNFLRYIKRFLIAGIMEGTELTNSDRGTPQGGLISPVLANVYLHYVLDLWFDKAVKPKLQGEAYYVRYADDFLILFQYENEAKRVMEALKPRLGKFSLEVAEEKTRILPIGRYKGTKEDFDFLGFTFYNTKTRSGKYRLGIRSSKKKLKAKRQETKAWLRTRLTKPVAETMKLLAAVIRGHCNYYGISGNFRAIQNFWYYLKYSTYRMLNRRDQKGKLKYPKFLRI